MITREVKIELENLQFWYLRFRKTGHTVLCKSHNQEQWLNHLIFLAMVVRINSVFTNNKFWNFTKQKYYVAVAICNYYVNE